MTLHREASGSASPLLADGRELRRLLAVPVVELEQLGATSGGNIPDRTANRLDRAVGTAVHTDDEAPAESAPSPLPTPAVLATAGWLSLTYIKLVDIEIADILLMSLSAIALGMWVYGKWDTPIKTPRTRWIARAVALPMAAASVRIFFFLSSGSKG